MVKVYIIERKRPKREISKIELFGEFVDEGYAIQYLNYYNVIDAYIVDEKGNVIEW